MGLISFNPNLNLILVEVGIIANNRNEELFIKLAFDTGASFTVIAYDIIEYLGYEPEKSARKGRIVTGSGVEYAPIIIAKKLSLSDESIEKLDVYCHNFPPESYVDGVLGLNFLRNFTYTVYHDSGHIELKRISN